MNLIKFKKKIRALDILDRIQSFEVNEKFNELYKQRDQEKNDVALHSSILENITHYDSYEGVDLTNKISEDRYVLEQQYIDALVTSEVSQRAIMATSKNLTLELTADIQNMYGLNSNVKKKLESQRINYARAINNYDAQL